MTGAQTLPLGAACPPLLGTLVLGPSLPFPCPCGNPGFLLPRHSKGGPKLHGKPFPIVSSSWDSHGVPKRNSSGARFLWGNVQSINAKHELGSKTGSCLPQPSGQLGHPGSGLLPWWGRTSREEPHARRPAGGSRHQQIGHRSPESGWVPVPGWASQTDDQFFALIPSGG